MTVGLVTVPRILREKLGDEGADALVEFLNNAQVVVAEDQPGSVW